MHRKNDCCKAIYGKGYTLFALIREKTGKESLCEERVQDALNVECKVAPEIWTLEFGWLFALHASCMRDKAI